jgi:hypothetical protein
MAGSEQQNEFGAAKSKTLTQLYRTCEFLFAGT